jgi:aspartate carbamoyltransferase catalytic subunit
MKHIVSAAAMDRTFIDRLLAIAERIKHSPQSYTSSLRGKIVATIFFEPSTRTRLSFESAIARLGGTCISTENATETSSSVKGETMEDAIKVISNYGDAIIIRHKDNDAAERAASIARVPVINAGSGTTHHPTQALLDTFTIFEKFGCIDGKKIMIAGDLMRGRTCDSLVHILSKYNGVEFYFAAPEGCRIKPDLREFLEKNKCTYHECATIADCIDMVDVVYMTRVQKERFENNMELYERIKDHFILTPDLVEKMRHDAIIMHPLPRVGEIPFAIDADHRAHYFQQAENGLWMRMALLCELLGNESL